MFKWIFQALRKDRELIVWISFYMLSMVCQILIHSTEKLLLYYIFFRAIDSSQIEKKWNIYILK